MSIRRKLGISLLIVAVSASPAALSQSAPRKKHAGKDVSAVSDFETRVNQYVALRKTQAGTLPGPTNSATKLGETREQIRARIQPNRVNAKQGDIFTGVISTYFRKQIYAVVKGHHGKRVLTSLRRAEPVKEIPLQVNQPYPDGIPLQSMPPTLLLRLPKLPKELEYRIVGGNLVLLDVEPNLVVDILPDAIPAA